MLFLFVAFVSFVVMPFFCGTDEPQRARRTRSKEEASHGCSLVLASWCLGFFPVPRGRLFLRRSKIDTVPVNFVTSVHPAIFAARRRDSSLPFAV
jgi:hypothetical protein